MNRRSFFGLFTAPYFARFLPKVLPPQLTFKGIPIHFDWNIPYTVTIYSISTANPRKLGVITGMT